MVPPRLTEPVPPHELIRHAGAQLIDVTAVNAVCDGRYDIVDGLGPAQGAPPKVAEGDVVVGSRRGAPTSHEAVPEQVWYTSESALEERLVQEAGCYVVYVDVDEVVRIVDVAPAGCLPVASLHLDAYMTYLQSWLLVHIMQCAEGLGVLTRS